MAKTASSMCATVKTLTSSKEIIMAVKTIKALREEVESLVNDKVTNREAFETSVPLILACQARIAVLKENLKGFTEAVEKLGEQCREYAFAHDSVQKSYSVHPDGVEAVDVEINENTYHVAYGYGKWKCSASGMKLDQSFLAALPSAWTKSKLELVESAVTKAWTADADKVEAEGLMRPRKTAWTLKLSSDLCDICAS